MVRDYGRDKANRTAKAALEHSTLLHRFFVRPAAPAANENNTADLDAAETVEEADENNAGGAADGSSTHLTQASANINATNNAGAATADESSDEPQLNNITEVNSYLNAYFQSYFHVHIHSPSPIIVSQMQMKGESIGQRPPSDSSLKLKKK
jgi:hypothetical protein